MLSKILSRNLHQLWTPAPKQRLKKLREIDKDSAELFDTLYRSNSFEEQLKNAKLIVQKLFDSNS